MARLVTMRSKAVSSLSTPSGRMVRIAEYQYEPRRKSDVPVQPISPQKAAEFDSLETIIARTGVLSANSLAGDTLRPAKFGCAIG